MVARRSHQAGDHQLPHVQARARRPVLRQDFWPRHRLGMFVRQIQAHEASRRDLRQVRRRSHAQQGAPRAPRPHRAGFAVLARVVLQGPAQPHRLPAGHFHARPRAHSVLRSVRGRGSRRSRGSARTRSAARREISRAAEGISRPVQRQDGRRSHQGTAAPRGSGKALRRAARKDEDRSVAAEAHQVRQAPEGAGSVPQERQQAGMDDSGRDPGASAGVAPAGASGWRPFRDLRFERPVSPRHQPQQPLEEADGAARAGRHRAQRKAHAAGSRGRAV